VDLAASTLELFDEQHLMYIFAGQPRGLSDQELIETAAAHLVA
jgi:hypothetical protein